MKGCPVVNVRTDQSQLVEIFGKCIHELTDCFLKIRIQMLDYNLKAEYILGKKNELTNCQPNYVTVELSLSHER